MVTFTPKHESFCAKTAAGSTKLRAYREAQDAPRMSEKSVWSEVHRLSMNPKVALRLDAIQADCREVRYSAQFQTVRGCCSQ